MAQVGSFCEKRNPEKGKIRKMKENLFPESGKKQKPEETDPEESKKGAVGDQGASFSEPTHWVELFDHIRSGLLHIKNFTRLVEGKFVDKRFGAYFSRSVNEDIEEIDSLLRKYLDYMRVKAPIEKADTVNDLIEEMSKRYQGVLEEKGIKLFKKFEPGLPGTTVPDEPMRFVLNSLLWYGMTWVPSIGSLGLFTKASPVQPETTRQDAVLLRKEVKAIEIVVIFSGHKEPLRSSGTPEGIPVLKKEGIPGLMLRLVEEIVLKNRGTMKTEVDPKKAWVLISLEFPAERRKKIYYQPASE